MTSCVAARRCGTLSEERPSEWPELCHPAASLQRTTAIARGVNEDVQWITCIAFISECGRTDYFSQGLPVLEEGAIDLRWHQHTHTHRHTGTVYPNTSVWRSGLDWWMLMLIGEGNGYSRSCSDTFNLHSAITPGPVAGSHSRSFPSSSDSSRLNSAPLTSSLLPAVRF